MGADIAQVATAAGALGVVLLLVIVAARAARLLPHAARRGGPVPIRLAGTLALDTRRRLHLVEVGASHALVLTGGNADAMLAWPAPQLPAATPPC